MIGGRGEGGGEVRGVWGKGRKGIGWGRGGGEVGGWGGVWVGEEGGRGEK